VLRAYPRCDQKTAIAFVDDVMAKLPFQAELRANRYSIWVARHPSQVVGRR